MASPAAMLAVQVQAEGIQKTAGQLRSLNGDLDKSGASAARAGDDLEKTGKRGSLAMKGIGLAAGAFAGIAVFGALKKGIGTAVDEFEEARKVGANTTQVIKSTGGAANVSASQVANLAGAISKKTGIDDEAIQSGSNLLLTFTKVRNETGKGRDIFNQATQAAVDLSAAGFGSVESASKTMGKALNDPVKGMTALGKSGVTFSEEQKKAIAALMETGKAADRVKAQQIILGEVQMQVGGQAAAQATAMDKAKVAVGNLAEAAGAVLVPAFDKVATFAANFINQMIEGKSVGGALISTFRNLGGAVGTIVGVISTVVGWFKQHEDATTALLTITGTLAAVYLATLLPAIVATTAGLIAQAAAWTATRIAMLASPMGLIVIGLTAVVTAIVLAIKHWGDIKAVLENVWGWIRGTVGGVFAAVVNAVTSAWQSVKSATTSAWNAIKGFLESVWNGIKAAVAAVFSAIRTIISTYVHAWLTVITTVAGLYLAAGRALFDAVRDGIVAMAGAVSGAARAVVVAGLSIVQGLVDNFRNAGGALIHAVVAGLEAAGGVVGAIRNKVADGVQAVRDKVADFVSMGGDIVQGIARGITNAAGAVVKALGGVVGAAISAAKKKLHIGSPSRVFMDIGGDVAKGFALGIAGGAGLAASATNAMIATPGAGVPSLGAATAGVAPSAGGPLMHVENMTIHGELDFEAQMRRLAWAVETA